MFAAAGLTPHDRVFFAFSYGPFLGFWTAFESASRRGCLCIPGGGLSSLARVQLLLDNGVTAVCCTPTYALRMAEVAREHGLDLAKSQVRHILVGGEPGGSIKATRDALEGTWTTGSVWWGVKEGAIDLVSISDVVPTDIRAKVDTIRAGLKEGTYNIWKGPIVGQDGKEVLAAGQKADDAFLGGVKFYVKGVEGKVPN